MIGVVRALWGPRSAPPVEGALSAKACNTVLEKRCDAFRRFLSLQPGLTARMRTSFELSRAGYLQKRGISRSDWFHKEKVDESCDPVFALKIGAQLNERPASAL